MEEELGFQEKFEQEMTRMLQNLVESETIDNLIDMDHFTLDPVELREREKARITLDPEELRDRHTAIDPRLVDRTVSEKQFSPEPWKQF